MLFSKFNGERLREARFFRKKTISEIAGLLNVTTQTIFKYERGESKPNFEYIEILEKELGFSREYYFTEDKFHFETNPTFFEDKHTYTQKEKNSLVLHQKYISVIRDYLNQFVDFPKLDWSLARKKLSPKEYADYLRSEWSLKEEPITDMVHLLEEKGFILLAHNNNIERIDVFSSVITINQNSYFVILSDSKLNFYFSQQYKLACQLGHWLMHSKNDYNIFEKSEAIFDEEAKEFASNFLLPEKKFRKMIEKNSVQIEQYSNIKKYWNVTIDLMMKRSKELDLISEEEYLKLKRQYNYRGWGKKGPLDEIESSPPLALKQSVELLIDNKIREGIDISREIMNNYGIVLSTKMIEELTGVEKDYLKVTEPQLVKLIKNKNI